MRLWQEHPDTSWRVMLQDVEGDQQWGFSDAAQCLDFIARHLAKMEDGDELP